MNYRLSHKFDSVICYFKKELLSLNKKEMKSYYSLLVWILFHVCIWLLIDFGGNIADSLISNYHCSIQPINLWQITSNLRFIYIFGGFGLLCAARARNVLRIAASHLVISMYTSTQWVDRTVDRLSYPVGRKQSKCIRDMKVIDCIVFFSLFSFLSTHITGVLVQKNALIYFYFSDRVIFWKGTFVKN